MRESEIGQAVAGDVPGVPASLEQSGLPTAGPDRAAPIMIVRAGHGVVGSAALEPYGDAAPLAAVTASAPARHGGLGQRLRLGG